MNEPTAWKAFGGQIHQDFVLIHGDFATGLMELFQSLDEAERLEIATYLRYLSNSSVSSEQKFYAWKSSGAAFEPSISKINQFLQQIELVLQRI